MVASLTNGVGGLLSQRGSCPRSQNENQKARFILRDVGLSTSCHPGPGFQVDDTDGETIACIGIIIARNQPHILQRTHSDKLG